MKIEKGFTLIELLVTMVILGILATFMFANVLNGLPRARDSQRKNDLKQLQTALQLYYTDNHMYPDSTNCNSSTQPCWQLLLGEDTGKYIKTMPKDPSNNTYRYCRVSLDKYVIVANLENTNDPDKKTDNSDCPTSGPNWYWVTNP